MEKTNKPMICLTDVIDVTIRSQSNFQVHSNGVMSSYYDAEMDEIGYLTESGKMDVLVDVPSDIVAITANSLDGAKRINEALGKTIAEYEDTNGKHYDAQRVAAELNKNKHDKGVDR